MRFLWDERKRSSNIKKHGIDFVDLPLLFEDLTLTLPDARFDYDEERFITLGLLRGILLVIAHTETDDAIRIISARKANKHEEERYYKALAN
jgi:uncharacterized DUF497 family protein